MSLENDTLISGAEFQARKALDFLLFEHVKKLRTVKVEGPSDALAMRLLQGILMDVPIQDPPEGVDFLDYIEEYYKTREE